MFQMWNWGGRSSVPYGLYHVHLLFCSFCGPVFLTFMEQASKIATRAHSEKVHVRLAKCLRIPSSAISGMYEARSKMQ